MSEIAACIDDSIKMLTFLFESLFRQLYIIKVNFTGNMSPIPRAIKTNPNDKIPEITEITRDMVNSSLSVVSGLHCLTKSSVMMAASAFKPLDTVLQGGNKKLMALVYLCGCLLLVNSFFKSYLKLAQVSPATKIPGIPFTFPKLSIMNKGRI